MMKTLNPKLTLFRDYHKPDGDEQKHSYWTTQIMPGFLFEMNSPKVMMSIDYDAGLSYQDSNISSGGSDSEDSRWDSVHHLTATWNQYLSRSVELAIRDRFVHTENPVLIQDDRIKEVLREDMTYDQNDGYLELSWKFGIKDKISLVYHNRYFDADVQDVSTIYGNRSIGHEGTLLLDNWFNSKVGLESFVRINRGKFKQSGESIGANLEDFYDYEGGLALNYCWHPNHSLFIKYNTLNKDFDNSSKGNEAIDFRLHKALMGFNMKLGPETDIYLEGGYFIQDIHDQNISNTNKGSIFKAALNKNLTKDFSFSMEGSGGYREDYFSAESLGPSKFHNLFGSANYMFTKNFRVNAYTIYNLDDFLSEERENKSWYSGTVFFFYLHHDLMLSVEFFHTEYESTSKIVENENKRSNSIFIHLHWDHNIPF